MLFTIDSNYSTLLDTSILRSLIYDERPESLRPNLGEILGDVETVRLKLRLVKLGNFGVSTLEGEVETVESVWGTCLYP